jgi:hypothetical protein
MLYVIISQREENENKYVNEKAKRATQFWNDDDDDNVDDDVHNNNNNNKRVVLMLCLILN